MEVLSPLIRLINWKTIVEIIILWAVIYRIALFLQGTKAVYLLRGLFIIIISLAIFQWFGLYVLSKMLEDYIIPAFVIFVVVIFQPELREGLISLGKRHIFYIEPKKEEVENNLRDIVTAVGNLSRKKTGALIAIKREMGLKNYIESGILLNADLSPELLQNIFHPLAPLHDGGVIVENAKVIAASCLFPLSDNPNLNKMLGMRHRAGIGLSEHCDAVVVIVSEENGGISLSISGQLTGDLSPNDLLTILKGQLSSPMV